MCIVWVSNFERRGRVGKMVKRQFNSQERFRPFIERAGELKNFQTLPCRPKTARDPWRAWPSLVIDWTLKKKFRCCFDEKKKKPSWSVGFIKKKKKWIYIFGSAQSCQRIIPHFFATFAGHFFSSMAIIITARDCIWVSWSWIIACRNFESQQHFCNLTFSLLAPKLESANGASFTFTHRSSSLKNLWLISFVTLLIGWNTNLSTTSATYNWTNSQAKSPFLSVKTNVNRTHAHALVQLIFAFIVVRTTDIPR